MPSSAPSRRMVTAPSPSASCSACARSTIAARETGATSAVLEDPEPPETLQAGLGAPRVHQGAAARVAVVLLEREALHDRGAAADPNGLRRHLLRRLHHGVGGDQRAPQPLRRRVGAGLVDDALPRRPAAAGEDL